VVTTRTKRRSLLPLLVVSAALSLARPAHAVTPEQAAAADALFKEGRALLKDGKTVEACAKFAESNRLDPQLGTLTNLASCHATASDNAAAYVEFTEVQERAAATNDKQRVQLAEKRLAELRGLIVTVRVSVAAPKPDETVTIAGRELATSMWDRPLVYNPGAIEIVAKAKGHLPFHAKLAIAAGTSDLTVSVPPLEPLPVAPPAPKPPPAPPATIIEEASPRMTIGIVAIGVGVAGLGLGTAFGLSALSSKSSAEDACPSDPCSAENVALYKQSYADADAAAVVSTVGFVVGVLAAGFGTYLVLTRSTPKTTSAKSRPPFSFTF